MADSLNDESLDPGTGVATDLLLNADGHIAFQGGDLVLARGVVGAMQEAKLRCRFWRGTWFLDFTEGVEHEVYMGQKPADVDGYQNRFRTEILKVGGVRTVLSVSAELTADRALRLSYTANYFSESAPRSDSFLVGR